LPACLSGMLMGARNRQERGSDEERCGEGQTGSCFLPGEFLLNSGNTPDKAQASHEQYRQSLMVMLEKSGRWMTLRFNEKSDKLEPDSVFRLDALAEY